MKMFCPLALWWPSAYTNANDLTCSAYIIDRTVIARERERERVCVCVFYDTTNRDL